MLWLQRFFIVGLATVSFVASAEFTGNHCFTRYTGNVDSLCPGHTLPQDRLRNFDRSSHAIECSANADNYIRRPQKYDFLKWSDLRAQSKNQEAFDMRRALPDVHWQGTIPYETVEVWSWQECSIGTSSYHCGTERVCEYHDEQSCDSNGKHCHNHRVKTCHDDPNSCYYDHDRSESMHCSNESMDYDAKYERPSTSEWNVSTPGYAEFIPNKYDLMPGEVEVVQTYNNDGLARVMNPHVEIGDAWNKYQLQISGSGAGAQCIPHAKYSINVNVVTVERNTNKASPNAFRLPVDENGTPENPIANWMGNSKVMHGQPISIMLDDSSAAVVKALAEHSQEDADRIQAQAEAGKITNHDGLSNEQAANEGFFKSTMVRIRLVKKNRYWWDHQIGWDIYNDDVRSVTASNNSLSKDQEILLADKWEIDLMHSKTHNGHPIDMYWRDSFALAANRVYALQVSMYQRGVPFYKQDCETDPRFACTWPIVGRSEDSYYSKPMEIRFETNRKWSNSSFRTFMNDGIGPFEMLGRVFEPLVAEPTKGENND